MQKAELGDDLLRTLDGQFMAELRLDEAFTRLVAKETGTLAEQIRGSGDAEFRALLGRMGTSGRGRLASIVRKRGRGDAAAAAAAGTSGGGGTAGRERSGSLSKRLSRAFSRK